MSEQASMSQVDHPPHAHPIADAEPTDTVRSGVLRNWLQVGWRSVASSAEWMFGGLTLLVGLSVLATIPILQVLSLGYLLEVSGRVARCGKLRFGFVGFRKAARIGSVVLGTWIALLPARAVSGLWYSSLILNGDDPTTRRWRWGLVILVALTILHVSWAWFRGGRLRHFFWPAPRRLWARLRQGSLFVEARDRFWASVQQLRLPHYFRQGLTAGCGAFIWLFLPISLMVLAARLPQPVGAVSGVVGAISFATVLIYLPFLQTRFAALNRMADLFDVRSVRACFRRAPIAFWISLASTLALALPLYLLKAELIPREAAWLPSLVFIVFTLPARWITGWAVARSERRDTPRHVIFRVLARLAFVPVLFVYVVVVYFTQYVSWYGGWSLYEQHAFLLPVPFLGM